ncbi:MAG: YlmC/YmxH family sporulation protein [Bacilli bacterium]|nr:YlmC/YmxH family sporulation protein [Bacilli bacterium]
MMLSSLQNKDIINLVDGRKIGSIIDVNVNENGHIEEIAVQKKRFLFFSSGIINIKWKQIDKIGKDVILINVNS